MINKEHPNSCLTAGQVSAPLFLMQFSVDVLMLKTLPIKLPPRTIKNVYVSISDRCIVDNYHLAYILHLLSKACTRFNHPHTAVYVFTRSFSKHNHTTSTLYSVVLYYIIVYYVLFK